jgi:hypothetical protein
MIIRSQQRFKIQRTDADLESEPSPSFRLAPPNKECGDSAFAPALEIQN